MAFALYKRHLSEIVPQNLRTHSVFALQRNRWQPLCLIIIRPQILALVWIPRHTWRVPTNYQLLSHNLVHHRRRVWKHQSEAVEQLWHQKAAKSSVLSRAQMFEVKLPLMLQHLRFLQRNEGINWDIIEHLLPVVSSSLIFHESRALNYLLFSCTYYCLQVTAVDGRSDVFLLKETHRIVVLIASDWKKNASFSL